MPDYIKKLTDLFSKFPTIGPRTAGRFVFYLLNLPKENIDELVNAIQEIKNKIKLCEFCFNPFENDGKLCYVCQNSQRNNKILCIVEKETDLLSIENTRKYKGLYFILDKSSPSFRKGDIDKLRIKELIERIKDPGKFGLFMNVAQPKIYPVKSASQGEAVPHETGQFNRVNFSEIIIALNPTPEGESSSVLIERALKELTAQAGISEPLTFKITHLAKGLPVGSELEYADEETLESAFEGRK